MATEIVIETATGEVVIPSDSTSVNAARNVIVDPAVAGHHNVQEALEQLAANPGQPGNSGNASTLQGFTAAQLRDRSTHTGSQSVSTITGLAAVATTGSYSSLSNRPTIPTSLSQLSGPLALGTNAQLPSPPDPASEATLRWSPGSGWIVYQEGASGETVDLYSWFEPTGYPTFAAAVSGGFAAGVSNLATIGSFADPDTNRVITYSLPIGFWFCYFIHEDDANADDAAFGWTPAFYSPGLGAPQTLTNLGRAEIDLGDGVKWHRMWRLNFAQGNSTATTTVTLGVT